LSEIHPTAIVHPNARIADNVRIGPFTIIKENVEIEEGVEIHSHVLIADGARIGKNCQIHHGAVISSIPQDLKFSGEETTFEIGENTVIREYCDLNRGTIESGKSCIGSNCFLMAYCHVAHDCIIGDRVILANGVQLGGHVIIHDWTIIGGLVPIHQFCTVGEHVLVGGGFRVTQDVPPYILAAGEPLGFKGLNLIGLKRRNFSKDTLRVLRNCYRFLYHSKLNRSQAMEKIRSEIEVIPEIQKVLDFFEKSDRGVIR
jgi:UDP-N-acetylglucosamine acyltransferase